MLNWIVIGIGDISIRRVIPAIQAEPRSRLFGLVTRDPAKAASYNTRVWSTLDEALSDPAVQATTRGSRTLWMPYPGRPPCWPAEPLPCGRTGSLSERDDKTALPEKRIADGYAHTTIAFAVADEVVTIR